MRPQDKWLAQMENAVRQQQVSMMTRNNSQFRPHHAHQYEPTSSRGTRGVQYDESYEAYDHHAARNDRDREREYYEREGEEDYRAHKRGRYDDQGSHRPRPQYPHSSSRYEDEGERRGRVNRQYGDDFGREGLNERSRYEPERYQYGRRR